MLEFADVAVAHAIELAVAPGFLLTGIAAILTVMTVESSHRRDRVDQLTFLV